MMEKIATNPALSKAKWALLAGSMLFLGACGDPDASLPMQPSADASQGQVSLSLFSAARDIRALDLDNIFAVVTDNDGARRFDQSTDITFDLQVENGQTLLLSVQWFEQFGGQDLLLGTFEFNRVINADQELEIEDDDYTTSGAQGGIYDVDNDGFSNLDERRLDSNPLDPGSTPENLPNVRIKRIAAADAPDIDGRYEDAWDNARFDDVLGNQLAIDNLMINQGAIRPDGQGDGMNKMRWFAMHDDTYLYLFVLGENIATANPIRDSGVSVHNDDNLNIYLDGNNSKGQTYDGFDDRHILIPLLASASDPDDNDSVFVTGDNSAPLPAFTFDTCLCTNGQHTWEIRIPMAEYGISVDSAFGIDIQIDLDHDGNARDAKWGWFHPSRDGVDVNNTWINPSFMGTAIASGS